MVPFFEVSFTETASAFLFFPRAPHAAEIMSLDLTHREIRAFGEE